MFHGWSSLSNPKIKNKQKDQERFNEKQTLLVGPYTRILLLNSRERASKWLKGKRKKIYVSLVVTVQPRPRREIEREEKGMKTNQRGNVRGCSLTSCLH